MSEKLNKNCSNVTIDQMIEHMTADIQQQTTDGQYIPLAFTPPTNDQHIIWNDFPSTQNIYSTTTGTNVNYTNQLPEHSNFQSSPPPQHYNNFVPNIQYNTNVEQLPIIQDMRSAGGGFIVYNHQNGGNGAYLQAGQELPPVCSYIPQFPTENHDFTKMFITQQQQQQHHQEQNTIYNSKSLLNQINLKHNASVTNINPQQSSNCTPLIENLVGNWVPNTSGTYSPFGNVTNDIKTDSKSTNSSPLKSNLPLQNTTNRMGVKKPRMIAEVKPMRPSYSDVLAKSVPSQSTKPIKANDSKETVSKENTTIKIKTSSLTSKKNITTKINQKTTAVNISTRHCGSGDDSSLNGDKNSPYHKLTKSTTNWNHDDHLTQQSHLDGFDKNDKLINGNRKLDSKVDKKIDNVKKNCVGDGFRNGNGSKHQQQSDNCINTNAEWQDDDDDDLNTKNSDKTFMKNVKRGKDVKLLSGKLGERTVSYGVVDKPPASGRRGQRYRRRENTNSNLGLLNRFVVKHLNRWLEIALYIIVWLFHLISDVCSLSVHLSKDLCTNSWVLIKSHSSSIFKTSLALFSKIRLFARIINYIDDQFGNKWWAFWNRKKDSRHIKMDTKTFHTPGLENNIQMPSTGEEAMKRLLACKGKDPYSILGVTPDCTDDDIKRYYKRQAFLVHPDKNPQPGAEEAFKILVHAFDIIGEPERRQSYDRKVAESHQVEQAWSELNDLLSQLHQKMEYAANTIRCTNCTKRHRRIHIDRPCYAARMCAQCKIHHSAKEGDIWAESTCFGFLWYYYACMDGAVYDITEWASCQRANLRHLKPNTHQVQYRIVLGKQVYGGGGGGGGGSSGGQQSNASNSSHAKRSKIDREPNLEEFLNNLYQKSNDSSNCTQASTNNDTTGLRSESARNRKKNKRKK